IRHAQAEVAEPGQPDAERKLTVKGLEQAKTLRKTLEHLEVRLDVVFTSPWRRARQTASALEAVADHLEVLDLLAAVPKQSLVKRIHEISAGHEHVALIGHQPWMSELTSVLLIGNSSAASSFEYKKCALYALSFTPAQCFLRFVLPSGVLRRLS
ncbi:MAG: hypothetical protein HC933_04875, partial [Pleurocapsa sp. SU_196_0]|nr:hypothetical protein [Pleurocapsa sp. SU_196_0]